MTEKLIDGNADVLGGASVFSRTRVPVRILMEHLEAGDRLAIPGSLPGWILVVLDFGDAGGILI